MMSKIKRTFAVFSAMTMCLAMLLYFPSGTFSNTHLGLTASAEDVTFEAMSGTEGYSNENYTNLLDGDADTKWCCSFSDSVYVVVKASEPISVTGYTISTGNDTKSESGRNPKAWTLSGCNDYTADNGSWVTIDTITDGELPAENCASKPFTLNKITEKYQYYKLEITNIVKGSIMQISELAFTYSTCDHVVVSTGTIIEPTCTEGGYEVKECSLCHATGLYENGVPANGHEWVSGDAVAPTCTNQGYTPQTCSVCNAEQKTDIVPATGHTFDDGICNICGSAETTPTEPSTDENGVYQIGTAGELYWFADKVNNDNGTYGSANAVLTADITVNSNLLSSLEYDAEGNVTNGDNFAGWTPIGWHDDDTNDDYSYTGIFDGQNHTISGLYFNNEKRNYAGLFGYITNEISNVGVVDSYFRGNNSVGGVCGYNCHGTIKNCYNTGAVSGERFVGGLSGDNTGKIINSYNTGSVIGIAYTDNLTGFNDALLKNCYYLEKTEDENGGKSAAQFTSGEVAYLLSQGCTIGEGESAVTYDGSVWGQTIGTDKYPVLGGKKVLTNIDQSEFANDVIVYGQNAALDGTIGFNIYVSADDSYEWDKTIGGVTGVKNEEGLYVFTYNVAAKDMDNEIQFTVSDKIDVTVSVSGYLADLSKTDNESLKNLADSMSNYGSAAKAYFGRETVAEQTVTDDLSGYAFTVGTMPEGISYYGSSLILESETTIRHYFTLAKGQDIAGFNFTVGGESVEPVAKQGYYYIDIQNISAEKLGKAFAVSVNSKNVITNYSALSYANKVLGSDETDDNLKNLVKALYVYSQNALAYINADAA